MAGPGTRRRWLWGAGMLALLLLAIAGRLLGGGGAGPFPDGDPRTPAAPEPEPTVRLVGRGARDATVAVPAPAGPASPPRPPGRPLMPPMDLEFVDAGTGRRLPPPERVVITLAAPHAFSRLLQRLDLDPTPPGYVLWDANVYASDFAPAARHYRAVVPLRPEVEVWLEVRRSESGERVDEVQSWWTLVGQVTEGPRLPARGGRARIPGVAWLPGERFFVNVLGVDRGRAMVGAREVREVRLPPDSRTPVEIRIDLVPFPDVGPEPSPGLVDAPRASRVRGEPLPPEEEPPAPVPVPHPDPGRGSVVVRVTDRKGSPMAPGVAVWLGDRVLRTDAQGAVRFEDHPAGPTRAFVREAGVVPVAAPIDVVRGAVTEVRLREPEGGTLDVRVETPEGAPVGFARVYLEQPSGAMHLDVEGDTQRVDPFTDLEGRRTFRHVESGTGLVRGEFGSRTATAPYALEEGRVGFVRIVLPAR